MKSIYKSLVLTGVLALASTSMYAGDKACNSSSANTACKTDNAACHTSAQTHWNSKSSNRQVALSTTAERPGIFMTSKGERFCTTKAMKDRENGYTTTMARTNSDAWSKDVESSKQNPVKNPS